MGRWTDAQMDWARHGLRLQIERMQKPHGLNPAAVEKLRWEIETRQAVLNFVATGFPMPKKLEPMASFMQAMADAHINWYGRSDKAFRICVDLAWQRRRDAYRRLSEQAA